MKILKLFTITLAILLTGIIYSGCNQNQSTAPSAQMTDDAFLTSVVQNGYSSNAFDEDNLMSQVSADLNDGSAVWDNDNNPPGSPIDSLKKWGRIVRNVNIDYNITNSGDTLKTVHITRTITGDYVILGYQNGQLDSIFKPYTEVMYRWVKFKRIASTPNPVHNWRLYQISMLNGGTTLPQIGSSKVQMDKIEIYQDNVSTPTYIFNGPNFEDLNLFTTTLFGGNGIPRIDRDIPVKIMVYTTSQDAQPDLVAWHWARNTFGFHRVPFVLVSQTGGGPYTRIYSKTFSAFHLHRLGVHNGYITASTYESLWDSDPAKFASSEIGLPYRVTR
jgi:hypothetical protein